MNLKTVSGLLGACCMCISVCARQNPHPISPGLVTSNVSSARTQAPPKRMLDSRLNQARETRGRDCEAAGLQTGPSNPIVSPIKQDGNGLVVRCCEAEGRHSKRSLKAPAPIREVRLTDRLEYDRQEWQLQEGPLQADRPAGNVGKALGDRQAETTVGTQMKIILYNRT